MGAGHSHDIDPERMAGLVNQRAKTVLIAFLAVVGLAAIVGMVALWPSQVKLDAVASKVKYAAPGVSFEKATITGFDDPCPSQSEVPAEKRYPCRHAAIELTTGNESGSAEHVELLGPPTQAGLRVGDGIQVMRIPAEPTPIYSYFGVERTGIIWVMLAVFVVAVLAVARWRGFWALVGLVFSGAVLFVWMLPALAIGESGLLVGAVGSVAIMFVVLYVAHGVSLRTSSALAGTLIGVAISTGLGAVAVWFGRLSGYVDEAEFDLAAAVPGLDFRELLIAAMIVAGLGVLNDVTITQSSSVYELRAAAPELSRRRIFASGMRIGRDHIASTIYTIVFAYAGAALSVLMLLYFYDQPLVDLLATEQFGTEVLRTLASATGLVLAVPITTGIAALTLKPGTVDLASEPHADH